MVMAMVTQVVVLEQHVKEKGRTANVITASVRRGTFTAKGMEGMEGDMVRGFNKFLYYSNFNLQGRSTAMVVWRGSTAIVTTAGASMGTGCQGITSTGTVGTRRDHGKE